MRAALLCGASLPSLPAPPPPRRAPAPRRPSPPSPAAPGARNPRSPPRRVSAAPARAPAGRAGPRTHHGGGHGERQGGVRAAGSRRKCAALGAIASGRARRTAAPRRKPSAAPRRPPRGGPGRDGQLGPRLRTGAGRGAGRSGWERSSVSEKEQRLSTDRARGAGRQPRHRAPRRGVPGGGGAAVRGRLAGTGSERRESGGSSRGLSHTCKKLQETLPVQSDLQPVTHLPACLGTPRTPLFVF